MIQSFKHKGLKLYWTTGNGKMLPAAQLKKVRRILDAIDNLTNVPKDLEPFRLWRPHPYTNMDNVWSLDVSGNYRILFKFENGEAYDLDYIDPH